MEGNIERITAGLPLTTKFGWERRWKGPKDTATSTGNIPVQAAGAEILRVAIFGLVEEGIRVVAPVHDAVLIEAECPDEIAHARQIMEQAAEAVLGVCVRTDEELVAPGDYYVDPRGSDVWEFLRSKMGIDYAA